MSNPIENIIRHDANGTTIITVTQKSGRQHTILMDTWVYTLFPELSLHVKRSRQGRDEWYPACYVEGKLIYLHRLVGEGALMLAANQPRTADRTTIDHKNRVHGDCRLANLRAANRREQAANRGCMQETSHA